MSQSTRRFLFWLILWGGSLGGALSFASWPSDLGHAVCGPWGCGPPVQALIACHLAWLVALGPIAGLLISSAAASPRLLKTSGLLAVAMAVAAMLAILVHQYFVWWPQAGEFQRPYVWQRYGFVLITTVDVPIIQVLLLGAAIGIAGIRRSAHQAAIHSPVSEPSISLNSPFDRDLELHAPQFPR